MTKIYHGTPGTTVQAGAGDIVVRVEHLGKQGPTGETGATGATGAAGADGAAGQGVPVGGTTGQTLAKATGADFDTAWTTPAGGGDMLAATYDPTAIAGSAFARANHTGTQASTTITNFAADVAATAAVTANTAKVSYTDAAAVTANTAKVTNATHTGDVTGSGALTIANDAVTNAKAANMAASTIKARVTGSTGDPEDATATQVRTLLNVEDGADVTDTTNVTAAGALMDSEVDANLKTLVLPASTTITAAAATVLDDVSVAAMRTTLDVDQAGADNSTDVTLGGALDYLTIAGQVITRNAVDLAADVTGVLPEANLPDASTTAQGAVELATVAETDTGTDGARAVTPDGLEGSKWVLQPFEVACSDEATAIAATALVATFRARMGHTIVGLPRVSLGTACTTGTFTVDIRESGTTVLSTLITVDATEKTSTTAATPCVVSDATIADDAELTVHVTNIGDGTAAGLKVYWMGRPT